MRRWRIGRSIVLLFGFAGCSPPLNTHDSSLSLRAQSGASLASLPRVERLVLGGAEQIPLEDLWLVLGEIGSSTEGRVKRRDPPASLEAARQSVFSYREGEETTIAPSGVLAPGATYSILALGVGVIGSATVAIDSTPLLRHWGGGWVLEGEPLLYCWGEPPMDELTNSDLLPAISGSETNGVRLGVDESEFGKDLCVRVEPEVQVDGFVLPPTSVGGWLLDPLPLSVRPAAESEEQACDLKCTGNTVTGACVRHEQGVFLVEFCPGAYLLSAREASSVDDKIHYSLLSRAASRTTVVGPLRPDELYTITIASLDAKEIIPETLELRSGAADARLVLTEVLIDPLGSEPQSEWIEIQNVGTLPGSLLGLEIWDDSGGTPLPDLKLQAGQVGLIVREDFRVGADIVPAEDALPIVVAQIGQNGLRNTGEEVSLRDSEGNVLSKIPAKSRPEGVSSLRISPWAADNEQSFIEHPAPGASPGY
jgi:hypothetical protein